MSIPGPSSPLGPLDDDGAIMMDLWWRGDPETIRGQVAYQPQALLSQKRDATVYLGHWIDPDGASHQVAVKRTQPGSFPLHLFRENLIKQVCLWSQLTHDHLLPLFGIASLVEAMGVTLYVVTPFMSNGDAVRFLALNPQADRARMLVQVASALVYLHTPSASHEAAIMHGDINGANILIDGHGTAFLTDFSLLRILRNSQLGKDEKWNVASHETNRYDVNRFTAPELLFVDAQTPKTPANDVWAFGMLIYQLYSGELPFAGWQEPRFYVAVAAGNRPDQPQNCPGDVWSIALCCLRHDPATRPSAASVLSLLQSYLDRT